ncbi:MAG: hypothetical protein Q9201_004969 [Fulgogasparrea decipioides]
MPVFQESEQHFSYAPERLQPSLSRPSRAEAFIRAEYHEGSFSTASSRKTVENRDIGHRRDGSNHNRAGVCTSDRNELMERIKRGESPTWIPSQTLQEEYCKNNDERPLPSSSKPAHQEPTPLLPSAELQGQSSLQNDQYGVELSPPSEIKRPRSALHAGDFTKGSQHAPATFQQARPSYEPTSPTPHDTVSTSPAEPWYIPSQSLQQPHPVSPIPERAPLQRPRPRPIPSRSRAPSLGSHSSSYVAKAPTTPLVQQSNSTDLDFSPIDLSTSPSKGNRRHTLPPRPLQDQGFSPCGIPNIFALAARQPPSLHRDPTSPFQTHRPRRSLTTAWSLQASPSPQRPTFLSSRRQSVSSETSPLQYASMVGSYEESILRGWMSTAPSKPLDFTAQIGVMGKGNCKPKCPPHITVPFPAVFYKWEGGAGRMQSRVDDEPSPYVGHIDLQQLPTPGESKTTRRGHSKSPPADAKGFTQMQKLAGPVDASTTAHAQNQKKRRRTSPAPASPQGGYRIPQKGQLQIVIKNPNKTAVKLFLVPYDLEDMEAGTKTFIRQRCYSTDPIIDGLTNRPKSELMPSTHGDLTKNKPTLRYLIHVNICSPSTGRYYLYQHIRVVFANRVPDNKEQLQTEIQVPQPRYSAYNAGLLLSRLVSNSSNKMAKDKAYRIRSSGFGVGHEGMDKRHPQSFGSGSSYPSLYDSPPPPPPPPPVTGIPFYLSSTKSVDRDKMDVTYGIASAKDCPASGGETTPFPMHGGPPASPTPPFPFQRFSTYHVLVTVIAISVER